MSLYEGNCLEVMPKLEAGSVDMVLCDLPYGTTQNKWDSIIPLEILWNEYWRLLKPNGIISLTASQPFTSVLVSSQISRFKHEWIWIKNRGSNFANTVREPMKEHESVLIFSKGGWTYNKKMQHRTGGGVKLIGSVQVDKGGKTDNFGKFSGKNITINQLRVPSTWQKFNCEVGLHPTQKPVALMEYFIETYTNEGDLVLDNCMGSGTTGVACKNTKRKFIGIEKDGGYFAIAKERIGSEIFK